MLAIDKHHEHESYKIQAEREKEKELDRLLYVSMTRARKTLVLFNDEVFFSSNKSSFTERLKISFGKTNNKIWTNLPKTNHPETRGKRAPAPTFSEEIKDITTSLD